MYWEWQRQRKRHSVLDVDVRCEMWDVGCEKSSEWCEWCRSSDCRFHIIWACVIRSSWTIWCSCTTSIPTLHSLSRYSILFLPSPFPFPSTFLFFPSPYSYLRFSFRFFIRFSFFPIFHPPSLFPIFPSAFDFFPLRSNSYFHLLHPLHFLPFLKRSLFIRFSAFSISITYFPDFIFQFSFALSAIRFFSSFPWNFPHSLHPDALLGRFSLNSLFSSRSCYTIFHIPEIRIQIWLSVECCVWELRISRGRLPIITHCFPPSVHSHSLGPPKSNQITSFENLIFHWA